MHKAAPVNKRKIICIAAISALSLVLLSFAFMYINLLMAKNASKLEEGENIYNFTDASKHIDLAWFIGDTDALLSAYIDSGMYMINGSYEDAIEGFYALGGYMDSVTLTKECYLRLAKDKLAEGDFDGAYHIFIGLDDYKDSAELAQNTKYNQALSYQAQGDFGRSIDQLLSIKEYPEALEAILSSAETYAIKLCGEGAFDEAISMLNILQTEGIDVAALIDETYYTSAAILAEQGDFYSSYKYYENVLHYKDAEERYHACIPGAYDQAVELFKLGDYTECKVIMIELSAHDYELSEVYALLSSAWLCADTAEYDDVVYYSNKLMPHILLENAAELFTYNTLFTTVFLNGDWIGSGKTLTAGFIDKDGENKPFIIDNIVIPFEHYAIAVIRGTIRVYTSPTEYFDLYSISITDENTIAIATLDEIFVLKRA